MLFSIHTDQHIIDAKGIFGYSHGYYKLVEHFGNFTYRGKKMVVGKNEKAAQVQMFYMEPEWYNLKTMKSLRAPDFNKFYDHQYKIYGTYLEATKVWSHWIQAMKEVDEIWVGNQFSVEAVHNSGIKTPTYVMELGIGKEWQPFMRGKRDKIRFLHVDSDSPRKRADLAEQAFVKLFKDNPNVELTLKYHGNKDYHEYNVMSLFGETSASNIRKIYQTLSQEEMIELYNQHDVLLYPSEGEGFGFIPLQALASGMPVISTGEWCDYRKFFNGNIINSTIGKTQHTGYFEGEVILPELKSMMELMEFVFNNIERQCEFFYKQAPAVSKEYDWQNKCDKTIKSLISRKGTGILNPLQEHIAYKEYMYYLGDNRYVTVEGVVFDSEKRIELVTKQQASSLLLNGKFRYATDTEIKNANLPPIQRFS